ncbi:MAG: DNA-binding CsgD family transcriptional regulator [Nitriliruptoraceae bacterium]|jgi:DNA-binding CsgD family transcriptional regulator
MEQATPKGAFMLALRWDDGSTTIVNRQRTIGSDPACDTTLRGIVGLHLLVEAVGRWALIEDVSCGSRAIVMVNGVALIGRQALAAGAIMTVGPRTTEVITVAEQVAPDGLLTARQLDVMACLGDGVTVDEAAERLMLSSNTVRSHVQSAYRRMNVSSKDEALGMLFAIGVFPDRRSSNAHPDGLFAGLVAQRRGEVAIAIAPNFSRWEQVQVAD